MPRKPSERSLHRVGTSVRPAKPALAHKSRCLARDDEAPAVRQTRGAFRFGLSGAAGPSPNRRRSHSRGHRDKTLGVDGSKKRVIFLLPPGASTFISRGEHPVISLSLWLDWALIGSRCRTSSQRGRVERHADRRHQCRHSWTRPPGVETLVEPPPGELGEHRHAMVAVGASAHSFQGTLRRSPPR